MTIYNRFGDLHDLMRGPLMTLEFGILRERLGGTQRVGLELIERSIAEEQGDGSIRPGSSARWP